MEPSLLKKFIESQGWSFYGVVDFISVKAMLQKHRSVFDAWVAKGFHAGMDYLPRMAEDRYQPDRKLPGAKSALILAAWYDPDGGADRGADGGSNRGANGGADRGANRGANGGADRGIVARYARGRDYHKVLKKKLIELSDWLKSQNASAGLMCENYISVDSGPLPDRALAEAVGLGFFGKNTCLINPSKGSYFFIASLLTTLDLTSTPKQPMPNCGTCNRCETACPTGALKGNGVIDSALCISYLTIENKGPIPVELRPKIGNRIFGCDICQEVCPFNVGRAGKQEILVNDLKAEFGAGQSLDLRELLSMRTDEEFTKRFAGTPLMRAKRRGLLRNACVVAGNSKDKSLISVLKSLLAEETDPMLREHAEWAIKQCE